MSGAVLNCPKWCSGHDLDEPGGDEHFTYVAGPIWLGAYQRVAGVTTRPDQGTYTVCLRGGAETGERLNFAVGVVCDSGVELRFEDGPTGESTVQLLQGEARQLAAILLQAADRMIGQTSITAD